METKLTREDFEGYLSQQVLGMKIQEMKRRGDVILLEWIKKELKKFPSKSK